MCNSKPVRPKCSAVPGDSPSNRYKITFVFLVSQLIVVQLQAAFKAFTRKILNPDPSLENASNLHSIWMSAFVPLLYILAIITQGIKLPVLSAAKSPSHRRTVTALSKLPFLQE